MLSHGDRLFEFGVLEMHDGNISFVSHGRIPLCCDGLFVDSHSPAARRIEFRATVPCLACVTDTSINAADREVAQIFCEFLASELQPKINPETSSPS